MSGISDETHRPKGPTSRGGGNADKLAERGENMSGRSNSPANTDRTRGSSPVGRAGPTTPGLKILAIDDSPSARKLFQALLLRLGVELPDLRFAADAPEALQVFTQWHPDLVFVDIELKSRSPGLAPKPAESNPLAKSSLETVDGDTLTLQLLERNPRLHVVIVTACDRDHPRVKALLSHGAADVIVKPVLAGRVQEVLERFAMSSAGNGRPKGASRPA